jgi:hypothetical protein
MTTALNAQTLNYKSAKPLRQSKPGLEPDGGFSISGGIYACDNSSGSGRRAAGNPDVQLLGAGFPFHAERVMQPLTHPVGKRKELAVTIKFDRLLCRIKDDLAVMTALKMDFQHALKFVVYFTVQIARNLLKCVFTIHECLTSFKNLA